jgi:hypothetical protein
MQDANRTTRRLVIRNTAALAVVTTAMAGRAREVTAWTQDASPAAGLALAGLGLPEVAITVTDVGFQAPAQIPAGRVLLTATNAGGQPADVNLALPPPGVSLADVASLFGPPAATAAADDSLAGEDGVPRWIYEATWAGGPIVPPGETVQTVVELVPGAWILLNDAPSPPQVPQPITVGGDAGGTAGAGASPAATAWEPVADVAVELQEYTFVGLDRPVPAGLQTWRITNTGTQPHFVLLAKGPAGITVDQLMTLVMLPPNATPPPGFPYKQSDFDFNQPGLAVLSPGYTSWLALDLAPGTYAALCFVPDEQTGVPHAAMGMFAVFTVGEEPGPPAATPAG